MSFLKFLPMVLAQRGPQRLERIPEPSGVTDAAENVLEYNQVMTTKLVIPYAIGLEVIHRAQSQLGGSAIDLACGPGHFTLSLARHLNHASVLGIDLSAPMVQAAQKNAARERISGDVQFRLGDIQQLKETPSGKFDLSSFTEGAHHMPDLTTVSRILQEMDRITKPEGLIFVMDPVRLRSRWLTETYIETLAGDYVKRGLRHFKADFRNSMVAAWTPKELRSAVPKDSKRWWCHGVPMGLASMQMILGLPVGRKQVFIRPGFSLDEHPLIQELLPRWQKEVGPRWAKETLLQWKLTRGTLWMAPKRMIPPGR